MDLVASRTDSYLTLLSALAGAAPMSMIGCFILGAMRLAPIISNAPFFGGKTPAPIRVGLLIALTTVFLPHIMITAETLVLFNTTFLLLCVKEVFIGYVLSFIVSIPFYIAQSAGVTIDFQRGSSSLQVTDPTMQSQTSPLGQLYNFLLIVIFYQIDGLSYFFNAMFDTFTVLPVDAYLASSFFTFHHPLWELLWSATHIIMTVGIQLAAPCLLAILMTEMFLGVANRLAPQVQISFLGMSLKSLVGLAILWLSWFFILQQMQKQAQLWLGKFLRVVHTLNQ